MTRHALLQATVFLILVLNVVTTVYILHETEEFLKTTAQATNTGEARLCINRVPVFQPVTCNTSVQQHEAYTCQLNATDPDGDNVTFSVVPLPPDNESLFNVSPSGFINFTPTQNDTGNHSMALIANDTSNCSNGVVNVTFNLSVVDVNDPPRLVLAIENQTLGEYETLQAFFLNDHFVDPDGDNMTFSYTRASSTIFINTSIGNDSSVTFRAGTCGTSYYIFTATDPYNASGDSNIVRVEVECPPPPPEEPDSGGGGGGSSFVCIPELVCMPWSDCYPNGMQKQVCRDKNGCESGEIEFFRNCTYREPKESVECRENWLCDEWEPCNPNGTQSRECRDLAECGTTLYRPELTQSCTYIPTCNDGVMNGNETGIDCGGDCPPCAALQRPEPPIPDEEYPYLAILLVLGSAIILVTLLTVYRESLRRLFLKMAWLLLRHHKKQVFLSEAEKRILFEDLQLLEKQVADGELTPQQAHEKLGATARKLYSFLLDIPVQFVAEEMEHALDRRKFLAPLRETLLGFATRLRELETGQFSERGRRFEATKEEVRLLVCLVSAYERSEIERELVERTITDAMPLLEEIEVRLINAYEALQFTRVDLAKQEYLALLHAYEQLTDKQKERVHPVVQRLYHELVYVIEMEG